ncbi:hypothetical protein ACFWQG_11290 [Rhodococcus sp. NPDC058532]|uniref:hypothetical protein n=1 Tax=Rhodococcus sp. NPDC058532 TaxID=3346540 RepID=UPI003666D8BE
MTQPRHRRTRYEFLLRGELSERALAAFPELARSHGTGDYTRLYGPIEDDGALRAMLARFDTLGLTVVEMRQLPD